MSFEDPALQRYFAEGDQKAFTAVVQAYLPLVFSVAFRITHDRPLSEEVAQNVFSRLAGLRQGLAPGLSLTTWFHRITRTAALNALRAEKRRQRREDVAASFAMNESRFPWERISPVLDEVIEKLPQQDREVILSRFFLGETSEDLSRRLGLGQEAMKKRLQRALAKLRDQLGRRGIHTTTAALSLSLPVYGVETFGAALPSTIAAAASATPLAPSTLTLITTLLMKQSLTLSTLAILAAGSFWIGSQMRAAASLESRIATLRLRAGGGSAAPSPVAARSGGFSGHGGAAVAVTSIDWQRFVDLRRSSGEEVHLRRLNDEMQRSLAAMSDRELSAELDRLAAMHLKDEDYMDLEKMVLPYLAEKNPALAMHHVEAQLADDRMTGETFMAYRKWLAIDQEQAVQWLDTQAAAGRFTMKTLKEENPTRKWLEGSLLPALISRDAAAAQARLMNLPPEQRRGVFAVADILPGTEAVAERLIRETVLPEEQEELLTELARQQGGARPSH